eukprot:384820_1
MVNEIIEEQREEHKETLDDDDDDDEEDFELVDPIYRAIAQCFVQRCWTRTKQGFISTMSYVVYQHVEEAKSHDDKHTRAIQNIIHRFDVELLRRLRFAIKNGKTQTFIDIVIQFAKQHDDVLDAHGDDIVRLISTTFGAIASRFFLRHNDNDSTKSWNRWTCYICGSHNFCKYMNGCMNYNISKCSLCGRTQTDSIICKIQKRDSFLTVSENKKTDDAKHTDTHDDIDKLIQKVVEVYNIDLHCPKQNQNQCSAILYLAKQLILYKRWLHGMKIKTEDAHDVENTVRFNIGCLDDETYYDIFMKSIQRIQKENNEKRDDKLFDLQIMRKLIADDAESVWNVEGFMGMEKKILVKMFTSHLTAANIHAGWATKIIREVKKTLQLPANKTIGDDAFKKILLDSAESVLTQERLRYDMGPVTDLVTNNVDNIGNIET